MRSAPYAAATLSRRLSAMPVPTEAGTERKAAALPSAGLRKKTLRKAMCGSFLPPERPAPSAGSKESPAKNSMPA